MRVFTWICPLVVFMIVLTGCSAPPPPPVYLSLDGIGSAEETNRYYDSMKDRPPEATLAEWKKSRCFPGEDDPNDKLKAFYYNPSDLGLGREMRCAVCPPEAGKNANLISCLVSNHGPADGPTLGIALLARLKKEGAPDLVVSPERQKELRRQVIQDSLKILNDFLSPKPGKPKIFRGQTVAMDFDSTREANDMVRFYIYDAENSKALIAPNTVPTGLIPGLALDNEGVKFIRNCTYCHGGVFDPTTNRIRGASFLDFSLAFLNYGDSPEVTEGIDPNFAPLTQFKANKDRLNALNALVKQTIEKSKLAPLIADRIEHGNYKEDRTTKTGVSTSYIPSGWANTGKEKLFSTAVLPYCATCHFSQSAGFNLRPLSGSTDLQPLTFGSATEWFTRQDIQEHIQKSVCSSGDMPHAEVTRLNLLADPDAFGRICPTGSLPPGAMR